MAERVGEGEREGVPESVGDADATQSSTVTLPAVPAAPMTPSGPHAAPAQEMPARTYEEPPPPPA